MILYRNDGALDCEPSAEFGAAGGSTTTWGCTISDSDVRASDFGLDLDLVKLTGGGGATTRTDDICLRVFYTPEPGLLLQLASGVLALAMFGKRRRCANDCAQRR
jgi:hypothetical protein